MNCILHTLTSAEIRFPVWKFLFLSTLERSVAKELQNQGLVIFFLTRT